MINNTEKPIVVTFETGKHLVIQPSRKFNVDLFTGCFGKIKKVRFKK